MDVFKTKKEEQNFLLSKFTKIGIFHFTFMERFNSNTSVWLVAECGTTITEYLIGDDILMKAQSCHSVTVLVEFLLEREEMWCLTSITFRGLCGCRTLSKLKPYFLGEQSIPAFPILDQVSLLCAPRQPHGYPYLEHL